MKPMTEAEYLRETGNGDLDATLDALELFLRSHGFLDVASDVGKLHAKIDEAAAEFFGSGDDGEPEASGSSNPVVMAGGSNAT